jgi:hypothetical protein
LRKNSLFCGKGFEKLHDGQGEKMAAWAGKTISLGREKNFSAQGVK